jgi:hypothetical protein
MRLGCDLVHGSRITVHSSQFTVNLIPVPSPKWRRVTGPTPKVRPIMEYFVNRVMSSQSMRLTRNISHPSANGEGEDV